MTNKTLPILLLWTALLIAVGMTWLRHRDNQLRDEYMNRVITINASFNRLPIPNGPGKRNELDQGLDPMTFAEAVKAYCHLDMEASSFTCIQKYYDHLIFHDIWVSYGSPFDNSSPDHLNNSKQPLYSKGFTARELVEIMELLDREMDKNLLVLGVEHDREDGTIRVTTGISNHSLGGGGDVYYVKKVNGSWKIINTGPWIS